MFCSHGFSYLSPLCPCSRYFPSPSFVSLRFFLFRPHIHPGSLFSFSICVIPAFLSSSFSSPRPFLPHAALTTLESIARFPQRRPSVTSPRLSLDNAALGPPPPEYTPSRHQLLPLQRLRLHYLTHAYVLYHCGRFLWRGTTEAENMKGRRLQCHEITQC